MRKSIIILSAVFILAGVGCNLPGQVSPEERAENAEALDLRGGSSFVLRGTLMGFGGAVSEEIGSDVGRRTIVVESYSAGQSADLSYTLRVRRETEASKLARENYNASLDGIADTAPPVPQREYEEVDIAGSLATNSLDNATSIFLPAYWSEGDSGIVDDNSLLWLSTAQYDELVSVRESSLSIGLFDGALRALELADNVSNAINRLQGEAEQASRYKDIYKLEAQPEFGKARMVVGGKAQWVRTIQATNWFGTYTILANRDNPLILKVTLNPLSFGTLSLISPTKILDAFLGYEIVEVNL
jgi:hypothetical protein